MADRLKLLRNITIVTNGCWLWNGCCNEDGYGIVRHNNKVAKAHRISYEIFNGPIEDGELVLHKCDTPCCINPDHLFLGDDWDNAADRGLKGRQAKGSRHGSAKFNEDQIHEIRELYASGMSIKQVAIHLNKPYGTISNICTKATWAWLGD